MYEAFFGMTFIHHQAVSRGMTDVLADCYVCLGSLFIGVYYLMICLVGVACAIIVPRIPPLSRKPDTYVVEGKAMPETIPSQGAEITPVSYILNSFCRSSSYSRWVLARISRWAV